MIEPFRHQSFYGASKDGTAFRAQFVVHKSLSWSASFLISISSPGCNIIERPQFGNFVFGVVATSNIRLPAQDEISK